MIGLVGALVTLIGWRAMAARLQRAEPVSDAHIRHCAATLPEGQHVRAANQARQQLLAMMQKRRIPGMSVTVAVAGRIVWSEGYGFADVEAGAAACPDTRFRTASVAKPITALAMAKLQEAGRLDLDAPIQRYVPGFPDKGQAITARQLASHRAGIRHYRDDNEAFTQRHFDGVLESLRLFQDDPLLFVPGTAHEYSSYGYMLLAAVIEGAAQREFGRYLEAEIFTPLRMQRTTIERSADTLPGTARFYDHVTPYVTDGQVRPAPFVDMSSKWAGGGMLSTTEDLARFGSSLLPGSRTSLLSGATRELLFTPLSRPLPPVVGYGLGWMIMRDIDLRRVYMHFGAGSGATSWLGIFPADRVVVAVMANLGHAGFTYAGTIGIGSHFAGRPVAPAIGVAAVAFLGWTAAAAVLLVILARLRRQ